MTLLEQKIFMQEFPLSSSQTVRQKSTVEQNSAIAYYMLGFRINIIQMMHGNERTLKYDEPEVENVT